ncbi:MAG: serine hydrolase [Myxococcota bacterium]|nr:serine hydrolase [Myxococcota bacterium]
MKAYFAFVFKISLSVIGFGCGLTEPGNSPPSVNISSPNEGLEVNVGESVEIVAEATDNDGTVQSVRFYKNGVQIGSDSESPYTIIWNTEGESRRLVRIQVVAQDDDGATSAANTTVYTNWIYEQPENTGDGWVTASLLDAGLNPEPFVDLMYNLRSQSNHRTHGILVARHGQLVFEAYFPGYRRDDQGTLIRFDRDVLHDMASATKSVTSALLGIAIDQGFIDSIDLRVHELFPEFPWLATGEKAEMSLEHMINMSSGLEWDQATFQPLDPRNDLVLFSRSSTPWSFYFSRPLVATPGTHMTYSEASINVVGEAIFRSSGQQVDGFADTYLFGELGIADRTWGVTAYGRVWSSGDLFLRPRDMLKIGQLYLQDGVWDGEQLIPQSWIDLASIPYVEFDATSEAHERYWAAVADKVGYSHAWWTLSEETYGADAFTASGWGDQRIMVLPEYSMVVVFTGGSQWEDPHLTAHEMMVGFILPSTETQ